MVELENALVFSDYLQLFKLIVQKRIDSFNCHDRWSSVNQWVNSRNAYSLWYAFTFIKWKFTKEKCYFPLLYLIYRYSNDSFRLRWHFLWMSIINSKKTRKLKHHKKIFNSLIEDDSNIPIISFIANINSLKPRHYFFIDTNLPHSSNLPKSRYRSIYEKDNQCNEYKLPITKPQVLQ